MAPVQPKVQPEMPSRRRAASEAPAGEPLAKKRQERESAPSPSPSLVIQRASERRMEVFEATRLMSFTSKLGSDIVELYVGPNRVCIPVHKKLICDKVPLFNGRFNSAFKEAEEGTAEFLEDDPSAFGLLIEWCYMGTLQPLDTYTKAHTARAAFSLRIKVYLLAEKYCLDGLMDHCIDSLVLYFRLPPTLPTMNSGVYKFVFDKTLEGSPLRLFMAMHLYHKYETTWYGNEGPVVQEAMNLACEYPDIVKDIFKYKQAQSGLLVNHPNPLQRLPSMRAFHVHTAKGILICPHKAAHKNLEKRKLSKDATTILMLFRKQWYWAHGIALVLCLSWIVRSLGLSQEGVDVALTELQAVKMGHVLENKSVPAQSLVLFLFRGF